MKIVTNQASTPLTKYGLDCAIGQKGNGVRTSFIGYAAILSLYFLLSQAYAATVYVSTFNLNSILEINSDGSHSTFATSASGLNYPVGLAFNSSGSLLVANSGGGNGNPDIEAFSTNGAASVFVNSGFTEPWDIAFDGSGNLYVSDNTAIEEFDTEGHESIFATTYIDIPSGLAFDGQGNLYVANYNNTISEFSQTGTGSVFASSGLANPQGLAFYDGNLYVANQGNSTIEKFNALGQASVFASTNLLNQPIGIAFDSSGNLFVANHDGDILEFGTNGIGTVFASGLGNAVGIAVEVPEPSSLLLLSLGFSLLALVRHGLPASGGLGDGGFHRHRRRFPDGPKCV